MYCFWIARGLKLSCTYCNSLHGLGTENLCEFAVPYSPRRVLRLAGSNLLTVPPGKAGKYGSKSFVRESANLWNSLRGERDACLRIV